MARCTIHHFGLCSLFTVAPLFIAGSARSQSADLALTRQEEEDLDSLASHTAHKIREANRDEEEPKVLVIDFFRSSPGNPSQLGELLADRFSASLTAYAVGMKILDRKILKDYLTKEWTTLEDLQSKEVCLRIGRQMGATGVILGTLYEENGFLSISRRIWSDGERQRWLHCVGRKNSFSRDGRDAHHVIPTRSQVYPLSR